MNVLIIGSGGREHALAWKIKQSPGLGKLFIAPGNAGTAALGQNVALEVSDFAGLGAFARENSIEMVVVGPEVPLVEGITDYFRETAGLGAITVIGPDARGAMLEGSKDFAKAFMIRHGIPTARYQTFGRGEFEEARHFLSTLEPPFVLKADGLAAGKGVLICKTLEEARAELRNLLIDRQFGKASEKVVIEEFLHGIEISAFVLTDGENYLILPSAKDYKRVGEGDTGPNTGGMGSVSPVPFATEEFNRKVSERVILPTIRGLISEGIDYRGFIFFGLMNVDGDPYVIEYNARMGDPEAETVIPRIKNDLLELFLATGKRQLDRHILQTDPRYAAAVMLVSEGYPGNYDKNKPVSGLEKVSDSLVFHAGTITGGSGQVLTSGGRVMAVTSFDEQLPLAFLKSYRSAAHIDYENKSFRKDLGQDLLRFLK
jgi:phosphoribosylamine--glycine ligase